MGKTLEGDGKNQIREGENKTAMESFLQIWFRLIKENKHAEVRVDGWRDRHVIRFRKKALNFPEIKVQNELLPVPVAMNFVVVSSAEMDFSLFIEFWCSFS